jgi:hypothetical protein
MGEILATFFVELCATKRFDSFEFSIKINFLYSYRIFRKSVRSLTATFKTLKLNAPKRLKKGKKLLENGS